MNDQQLAPFKAVRLQETDSDSLFTSEQDALYRRRYEEGYDLDLQDSAYVAWLKINNPEAVTSLPCSEASSEARSVSASGDTQQLSLLFSTSVTSMRTFSSNSVDVISEVLALPKP